MSRGACTFKQTDVTKAIKAMRLAGLEVAHVKVCKDGIIVVPGKPDPVTIGVDRNEWDAA
jgi:hypothetical protein